jgi:hypothetical protein
VLLREYAVQTHEGFQTFQHIFLLSSSGNTLQLLYTPRSGRPVRDLYSGCENHSKLLMVLVKFSETLKRSTSYATYSRMPRSALIYEPPKLKLFHDIWPNCLIFGTCCHFLLQLSKLISILPSSLKKEIKGGLCYHCAVSVSVYPPPTLTFEYLN